MITPRHINQAWAAIRKQGLIERDFDVIDNHDELIIKYKKADFYFRFARRTVSPPVSLATGEAFIQAVASALSLPYSIEYKPSILSQPADVGPVSNSAKSFDYALATISRWLAWIKKQYGPFNDYQQIEIIQNTPTHQQAMDTDEIIKKQAQDTVANAMRYNIHRETDKCSDAIISKASRIYQPADKAIYFLEAIRLVNEEIQEHRSTCKEKAGCPTEKKYEQVIFYLQQELDKLPVKAVSTNYNQVPALPAPSTEIEKVFISHSSKDAGIVEEVIDLLEIIGVRHEQIFCSSFEGYSIGLGQDFLQRIKDELNGNVLVLFIITSNFYNSHVSLCEMGAAWVKTSKHIPIVVPPLSYEDVKGVIPLTQGFKINEPLKWNTLKQQLEEWFNIEHNTSLSVWERKRDKAIQSISDKIQPPAQPLQRATVRDLRRKGSSPK